jgi:hypothetical protein
VLQDDGWQPDVDAIDPGGFEKQWALEALRQAMRRDTKGVKTMLKRFMDGMLVGGLKADSWFREGLMYELLKVKPPPESRFYDAAASPATPAPSSSGADEGEEGTPPAVRWKGLPLEEANVVVRKWLEANAQDNPAGVTRDRVSAETGISAGQVSNSPAFVAFQDRRKAEAKPSPREIPLTDAIQAAVPSDVETPDELAQLIEEQKAERAREERGHKRRHEPS